MSTNKAQTVTTEELHTFLANLTSEQLIEAEGWIATHVPPRKVWGIRRIAEELGVSTYMVNECAVRAFDPLPVEYFEDRAWAYASALRAWIRRQNVPYAVRVALRAQGYAQVQAKTTDARANQKARRLAAKEASEG